MIENGKILAFIGPSGVGKNTLINLLRENSLFKNKNYFSISWTTRNPRPNEVDGEHYYFHTREEFMKAVAQGEFLEWAEFAENLYGTPLTPIAQALKEGKTVFIDLDTDGALQLKKIAGECGWNLLDMFIRPPSLLVLEKRLRERANLSEKQIQKRLKIAQVEIRKKDLFTHCLVNDDLKSVVEQILVLHRDF